ncbi:HpcH/HpaI aldolase/citrate lyase family protein [uncultured Clostridium sp.]|uniref:HpcH/HpaI aldolase/citrate lyase family protein n=1 Tax=uncultured Clostridium sp. TaxID=59620 RepID=UPI002606A4A8|nr:HpcH/HpaI aldolase/citrate lyase family protein [uncultured Clostridium sp.]
MRYLNKLKEGFYEKLPLKFNKFSDKNILKYAVGANLYMNGLMDVYEKIKNDLKGKVSAITICFEDSIKESDLDRAEQNIFRQLNKISNEIDNGGISVEDMPLIFIRVRNYKQFVSFVERLEINEARCLSGFVFPKFNVDNAEDYLSYTEEISGVFDSRFYVMPILESEEIIYKESRLKTLIELKKIIKKYDEMVLNIRVGGTDFSSKFGLRRSVDANIYDIKVVGDCLIDIINIFAREGSNYIISAPVWEYFSDDINSLEVKGLLQELKFDIGNGFFGKTVIHPQQVKYVNANFVVKYEDYMDAISIAGLKEIGGVFKGFSNNKMNEASPHLNWARKIIERADVFGVLKEGLDGQVLY